MHIYEIMVISIYIYIYVYIQYICQYIDYVRTNRLQVLVQVKICHRSATDSLCPLSGCNTDSEYDDWIHHWQTGDKPSNGYLLEFPGLDGVPPLKMLLKSLFQVT